MGKTIDVRAATLSGAFVCHEKVRVILHNGRMAAFNESGKVLDIGFTSVSRRLRIMGLWDVETDIGTITIKERCWTCGGWWKVARVRTDDMIKRM